MKLSIVIIGVIMTTGCSLRNGHPVNPNGPLSLDEVTTASINARAILGGQSEFVRGQSMLPIFGSRTLLLHREAWPVQVGQLIVINYNGSKYFHQVIAVNGNRFQTKGINNQKPDPWLDKRHYVGTVYWAGWFG